MSFLENPFAEEEEEAVPDTPFGNYDVVQRESKYNALILSESSLGNRRREVEEGHLAELHTLVERNINLRNQLSDLSEILTRRDPPPHFSEATGFGFDGPQPILEVLQRRVQEGEMTTTQNSASAEFDATIPLDRLLHSPHDQAKDPLRSLDEGVLEDLEEGPAEAAPLPFDATRLQHLVEVLVEDANRTRETGVKNAEGDLIYSFINYIQSELQQYMNLCLSVNTREASIQDKIGVVRQLKKEGALRLAKLVTKLPVRSSLFSSEYALAYLANNDLSEEIKRLEVVVALLLRNVSIKQKAFEYGDIARRFRAEQSQEELRQENDEIGREVLFLRKLLSSSDTEENFTPPASLEDKPTDCSLGEQTATEKMQKFITTIISRIQQVETMLKEHDSDKNEDTLCTLSDTLAEIYVKTLERVVRVQNSCLRVFTALNADLEVRASRALLLTQLVLHNGGFENHMVEAVLDLPSQDLGAFPNQEVSDYFTGNDNEKFFFQFQADLEKILSSTKRHFNRQIALGNKVQHLVLQQLLKDIAEGPLKENLGIPVSDSSGSLPRIVLKEDIRKSVDAELEAASEAEDRLMADISASLEERRADSVKKLRWVNQQSYTQSLRQLFALVKENNALEGQLREEQETLEDERAMEPDLGSLESRLQEAQLEVKTLEAEEKGLIEEILALQGTFTS
ncbi:unnamed protein product [Phytomonas sp. Hart1]|nr:unnamed protein product [Phytomonas sp. Hart1]|eukprot:CCW67276.1 unnamed protein product [Phytomonas sp. isolate Hart1]